MTTDQRKHQEKSDENFFISGFVLGEESLGLGGRITAANRTYYSLYQALVARYLRKGLDPEALRVIRGVKKRKVNGVEKLTTRWEHAAVWDPKGLAKVFDDESNAKGLKKISRRLRSNRELADYKDKAPDAATLGIDLITLSKWRTIIGDDSK